MPTPITREQLDKLNGMRSDLTAEQQVELDGVNRRASAFTDVGEFHSWIKKSGYQRGDDPESLVRTYAGLTGWEPPEKVGFGEEKLKAVSGLVKPFVYSPTGPVKRIKNVVRAFSPSPWDIFSKGYLGKVMTPEEAEEYVLGQMDNLYDPSKQGKLTEFFGMSAEEQKAEAVGNENKRRGFERQVAKPSGTNAPRLNMPGAEYSPFTKEQQDIPAGDEKQTAAAVEKELEERAGTAPMLVFAAAAEYLTPEQESLAGAVAFADDFSNVWKLHEKQIKAMNPEQFGAFQQVVFALNPELDRNLWERQAGVFGMAERQIRQDWDGFDWIFRFKSGNFPRD